MTCLRRSRESEQILIGKARKGHFEKTENDNLARNGSTKIRAIARMDMANSGQSRRAKSRIL